MERLKIEYDKLFIYAILFVFGLLLTWMVWGITLDLYDIYKIKANGKNYSWITVLIMTLMSIGMTVLEFKIGTWVLSTIKIVKKEVPND